MFLRYGLDNSLHTVLKHTSWYALPGGDRHIKTQIMAEPVTAYTAEKCALKEWEIERGDWTVSSMLSFQIGAKIRRQNKW